VVDALNRIPGVKCIMAGGAFYAFPDARQAIAKLHQRGTIKASTDVALSEYLLENGGVAVVPGSAFGSEGYIRLSFATSMDNLQKALERLAKALA
jgi:aspartate aminotransferase